MRIIHTKGGEYPDCIVKHFDLTDYEDGINDKALFWGWASIDNELEKTRYQSLNRKVFINTAQPCEIINGYEDIIKQSYFDEVFTICPYTAEVLNKNQEKISRTIYTPICFPYPEKHLSRYSITTPFNKTLDVVYYGNIHHRLYYSLLDVVKKFKYAFSTTSNESQTQETRSLITHHNLTSQEKWSLLSSAKINVGFNLIFLSNQHLNNLKKIANIDAFKNIDVTFKKSIMPQMKTRMVESAACKTLMLMYKDEWNVIEKWFEPNKHFLYWEDFQQLEEMIRDISSNYQKYWHIVENAHEHARQYSIENLMNKIK